MAPLALFGCMEAESREVADQPGADSTVEAPAQPPRADASEDAAGGEPAEPAEPTEETSEVERRVLSPGTELTFRVESDVSTDSHASGDLFRAVLAEPVRGQDGEVALAAGTPSRWRVTESAVEDGRALLAFELSAVEVDGRWIPVEAAIQETRLEVDDPDSGGETAAKIGIGTAAGALIGQILGKDTESTLTGAGVGAAVGTVVALSTRSGKATLPSGSTIEVDLLDAIDLSGGR